MIVRGSKRRSLLPPIEGMTRRIAFTGSRSDSGQV
jgi:hypothetical protein